MDCFPIISVLGADSQCVRTSLSCWSVAQPLCDLCRCSLRQSKPPTCQKSTASPSRFLSTSIIPLRSLRLVRNTFSCPLYAHCPFYRLIPSSTSALVQRFPQRSTETTIRDVANMSKPLPPSFSATASTVHESGERALLSAVESGGNETSQILNKMSPSIANDEFELGE